MNGMRDEPDIITELQGFSRLAANALVELVCLALSPILFLAMICFWFCLVVSNKWGDGEE
jgi:hypothetical protein